MTSKNVYTSGQNAATTSTRLAQCLAKWSGSRNHTETTIPGLTLTSWESTTPPTSYTHNASICLIAQGKKQVVLGDERYIYDANHFLISSVNLPVIANIIEASPQAPYLGLILELDLQEISQLMVDTEMSYSNSNSLEKGIGIGTLTEPLLDAFVRLVDLLEEPNNIAILAPMIKREIFFRLLSTEQGKRLHQLVTNGSHTHHISRAIEWIKRNYIRPLNVSELASYAGMSKSAFYNHFRSITSMTPLQFQKKLRLNEARRLMLTENLDALATTFKVGYESPSQFSREYSRLFGAPPVKDIKQLKDSGALAPSS
ncbi:AraC family transcriptional regulator [Vibrio tritonius]|uniref:AraC family transcriptional regulator n=1 Tax=Vibrio tritonius TaxID=1435069 RepID=A0ABS7YVD7_9VIBR|nr:AraC family transcriptional regulator [Vibrio tritonius]MCA2018290.1 AraC family transcriptional regulator [Vibrio tritonius]